MEDIVLDIAGKIMKAEDCDMDYAVKVAKRLIKTYIKTKKQ